MGAVTINSLLNFTGLIPALCISLKRLCNSYKPLFHACFTVSLELQIFLLRFPYCLASSGPLTMFLPRLLLFFLPNLYLRPVSLGFPLSRKFSFPFILSFTTAFTSVYLPFTHSFLFSMLFFSISLSDKPDLPFLSISSNVPHLYFHHVSLAL